MLMLNIVNKNNTNKAKILISVCLLKSNQSHNFICVVIG